MYAPLKTVYAQLKKTSVSPAQATLADPACVRVPLAAPPRKLLAVDDGRAIAVAVGGTVQLFAIEEIVRKVGTRPPEARQARTRPPHPLRLSVSLSNQATAPAATAAVFDGDEDVADLDVSADGSVLWATSDSGAVACVRLDQAPLSATASTRTAYEVMKFERGADRIAATDEEGELALLHVRLCATCATQGLGMAWVRRARAAGWRTYEGQGWGGRRGWRGPRKPA